MADAGTDWGIKGTPSTGPEIIMMSTEKRPWDLHMFFFQIDTGGATGFTITSAVLGLVAKGVIRFHETPLGLNTMPYMDVKLNRPAIFTAKDCDKAIYIAQKLLSVND